MQIAPRGPKFQPVSNGGRPSVMPGSVKPGPFGPSPQAGPDSEPVKTELPIEKASGLMMLFTALLIFNHFGRPFEIVLVGYKIPAIICSVGIVLVFLSGALKVLGASVGINLLLVLGWMSLSAPFSLWKSGSLQYVAGYLQFWVVLFLMIAVTPKTPRNIAKLCAVVAASCIFHILAGGSSTDGRFSMNGTTFGNSDDVALLAGFAIPFTVLTAVWLKKAILRYPILIMGVGYLLLTTGRTATRAAIPALFVMLIVYIARSPGAMKGVIAAGAFCALFAAFFALPQSTLDRFATLGNSFGLSDVEKQAQMGGLSEADQSLLERKDLVKDAIQMAVQHPIFGVGPGEFVDYRAKEMRNPDGTTKPYLPSHNTFLQVASEIGIVGLFLYLAFLISICFSVSRIRKMNREKLHPDWQLISQITLCIEAAMAYFCVCAIFMTCDRHPHQFVLAGIVIALERMLVAAARHANGVPTPLFATPRPPRPLQPSLAGVR